MSSEHIDNTPEQGSTDAVAGEVQERDPPDMATSGNQSAWATSKPLMWSVVALAVVVCMLGMFWTAREIARHEAATAVRNTVGVVDVEQALAAQRLAYLKIVARPDATEQERNQATEFIKASAQQVNEALTKLAQECTCVLLIKPAVLQYQEAGLVDHTPRLMELLPTESNPALTLPTPAPDNKGGAR